MQGIGAGAAKWTELIGGSDLAMAADRSRNPEWSDTGNLGVDNQSEKHDAAYQSNNDNNNMWEKDKVLWGHVADKRAFGSDDDDIDDTVVAVVVVDLQEGITHMEEEGKKSSCEKYLQVYIQSRAKEPLKGSNSNKDNNEAFAKAAAKAEVYHPIKNRVNSSATDTTTYQWETWTDKENDGGDDLATIKNETLPTVTSHFDTIDQVG